MRQPGHTTLPKKKYSTHFCIRIYYLKGSLKIKILYSIMNSCFLSVNKMVLRKRGPEVSGAGCARPRRPVQRLVWRAPAALPLPSGAVCWNKERLLVSLRAGHQRHRTTQKEVVGHPVGHWAQSTSPLLSRPGSRLAWRWTAMDGRQARTALCSLNCYRDSDLCAVPAYRSGSALETLGPCGAKPGRAGGHSQALVLPLCQAQTQSSGPVLRTLYKLRSSQVTRQTRVWCGLTTGWLHGLLLPTTRSNE